MDQAGFFDLPDHLKRLSGAGDPLLELGRIIDFEAFRPVLDAALNYSEHYFPGDKGNKGFKIPSETDLKGKFESWVNIFRIDDFVGTVVGKEGGTWTDNKPVNAGGHTGYWIDREVLAILNEQIIKP